VTEHDYITPSTCNCRGKSYEGSCAVCEGGLSVCRDCHAFEGGLTTECPGEHYDTESVYRGERDYFGGQWHEGVCSRHCPKHYRLNVKPS
jgi:hypothetical protein